MVGSVETMGSEVRVLSETFNFGENVMDFDGFVRKKKGAITEACGLKKKHEALVMVSDDELRRYNQYFPEGRAIIDYPIPYLRHSTDQSIRELARTFPQLSNEGVFSRLVVISMQLSDIFEEVKPTGRAVNESYVFREVLPLIDHWGYKIFNRQMGKEEYNSILDGTNPFYKKAVLALRRIEGIRDSFAKVS